MNTRTSMLTSFQAEKARELKVLVEQALSAGRTDAILRQHKLAPAAAAALYEAIERVVALVQEGA